MGLALASSPDLDGHLDVRVHMVSTNDCNPSYSNHFLTVSSELDTVPRFRWIWPCLRDPLVFGAAADSRT